MSDVITCDRSAPSKRLTVPASRQDPDGVRALTGESLPRLRHRRRRRRVLPLTGGPAARVMVLRLQPLRRNILRRLLLLLRPRRRHLAEDDHVGPADRVTWRTKSRA